MTKLKLKKGDQVLVIAGKEKGRTGRILRILPDKGRITIEGLNLVKKHRRARKTGEKGQIVMIPRPIDASNVKILCPKCNQATRIANQIVEGRKFRICKKCKSEI